MRDRRIAIPAAVLATAIAVLGTLAGCAAPRVDEAPLARPNAQLFFEDEAAEPGFPRGTDIARSDWPSTPTAFQGAEYTFYREYLSDYQGYYPIYQNLYQRRFYSVRTGVRSR